MEKTKENNTMYKQAFQIYDENLEVGFYIYKYDNGVCYVKQNEILNSNLLVNELTYLFVDEYCLLSTFMYSLMQVDYRDVDNERCNNVVHTIIDRLCNG